LSGKGSEESTFNQDDKENLSDFRQVAPNPKLPLNTVASRYRYALQKLKDWVPEELGTNETNSLT